MCAHCRRFFLFALIMVLTNHTAISIFRAVAAIFRAVVISNMMAFLFVGFFLLFNGFIIQQGVLLRPHQLPCGAVTHTGLEMQFRASPGISLAVLHGGLQGCARANQGWWTPCGVPSQSCTAQEMTPSILSFLNILGLL